MEANKEMSQFEFNGAGEITKQAKDAEAWLGWCEKNYHRREYIGKPQGMASKSRPQKSRHYRGASSKPSVRRSLNISKMYRDWKKTRSCPTFIKRTEATFLFNCLLDDWDEIGFEWDMMLQNSKENDALRLR